MTIGLFGKRRNGKSLLALILGIYFSAKQNCPLYSNDLTTVEKGMARRVTKRTLLEGSNCVFLLDEFWRDMDSWDWKNPRSRIMSHWYQLQGHRDIVLIYTTQLMSQMNNRIRESTDYLIYCEKRMRDGELNFKFYILDGFTHEIIDIWNTTESKVKVFYNLYNYVGNVESIFDNEEEKIYA